jgi:hypothetical protein
MDEHDDYADADLPPPIPALSEGTKLLVGVVVFVVGLFAVFALALWFVGGLGPGD